MTTMGQMALRLRGMLQAGQAEDLSELSEPYVAGSGRIALRYPRRNIGVGSIVCVGLTTFQTFQVSEDGQSLVGVAGVDGSPDENAPAGTLVRVKPAHTTWAMFDEMCGVVSSLSAPTRGLFGVGGFAVEVNNYDGVYPIPGPLIAKRPLRLLTARWRVGGTIATVPTGSVEWVPQEGVVRVMEQMPDADALEFLFAVPFVRPTSLADDIGVIGLPEPGDEDLLLLGAASNLALSSEGRRVSVFSQGDARRAEEVREGANIGVSRMYAAQFEQRVAEVYTRLLRLWPITRQGHPMFDQSHVVRWP